MNRIKSIYRRVGWTGMVLLAAALFFSLGAAISFLDGDTLVALKTTILIGLLLSGTILLVRTRDRRFET